MEDKLHQLSTIPYNNLLSFSNKAQQPLEINSLENTFRKTTMESVQVKKHYRYNIIWFKEGKGRFFIDTEAYDIKNNTIYCLLPGQVQVMDLEQNFEGYLISFSQEFLDIAYNDFYITFKNKLGSRVPLSVIQLCNESQLEIAQIVKSMVNEFENFKLLRKEILRNYLQIMLIHLSRQSNHLRDSIGDSKKAIFIKKFFNLLEQHYIEKKNVSEYAGMMAVSSSHLNEIIKSNTGFPVSYHIQQHIIKEAKRQALYTDLSLKEIAYRLGFEDRSHFSKFFKAFEGRNFSEFRRTALDCFK
jgi:AraC family transcriptional activator of pobA